MNPGSSSKKGSKGPELGHARVYRAVQAVRGRLALPGWPGQGTRARLRFPACAPARQAPETAAEPHGRSCPRVLKVLLVDDDELIQLAMQTLLEALGHTATAVTSGEEALAALAAGLQPELVILDMNMPGLGGAETLARLRGLLPTVPVLLATGQADQAALSLLAEHPCVTLLTKPFRMEAFQQHLAGLELD